MEKKMFTMHALSYDHFLSTLKKYYYFQHNITFLRSKRRIFRGRAVSPCIALKKEIKGQVMLQ